MTPEPPMPWQAPCWHQFRSARAMGRLPHAILVTGPEGTGKRALSRFLAQSLLCEAGDQQAPCGSCRSCHLVKQGSHPDLSVLSPEEPGKQLKVDEVRAMLERVNLAVGAGRHRVFLIDPADALNPSAANALLKTLEEPVPGAVLLLCSDHPERLPATIRSRCQYLQVPSPDRQTAEAWLTQRGVTAQSIGMLLQMAREMPVKALRMHEQEQTEQFLAIRNGLQLIAANKADPVAIAHSWLKEMSLDFITQAMQIWLSDLVRFGFEGKPKQGIQSDGLHWAIEGLDLQQLLDYLARITQVSLEQRRNIRPQLAVEHLLVHWSELGPGEGVKVWR